MRTSFCLLTIAIIAAAGPLAAQQPASTNIGDRNASISAQATPRVQPVEPLQSPAVTSRTRVTPAPFDARERSRALGEPDVVLDVPNLSVDEITLEVDNLRVHLALDARVANLLSLTAGADAAIDHVNLTIKGVQAEAHLVVRLDNVAAILDRTLTTIDRNPELLNRLLTTVDRTVGTVGGVANTALQPNGVVSQTVGTVGRTLENVTAPGGLLSHTVNTLGQTVQRTLDTTGRIVERTLDTTGRLVNERTVGRVLDLPVVSQTTNAAGQAVRQVRDQSGAVIEYTLDTAGRVVNSRVVSQATGTTRR